MSIISPNMGLTISTIGTDSGFTWEQNLNSSLLTIDNHNHTPGNGNLIPPSGLNINATLTFNGQLATGLQAAQFTPQTSLGTLGAIYISGSDLYFNDTAGNVVQITSGGSVNATSSGISSGTATANFVSGVLVVNSASNTPANIQAGSILLGNNVANSKYLTLKPPNAMASNTTVTLPTIPASTNFMQLDSSGNMSASIPVSGGLTSTNIASATILGSNIAAATVTSSNIAAGTIVASNIASGTITTNEISATAAIIPSQNDSLNTNFVLQSTSSGSFSTTSSSFIQITGLGASLPVMTTGRPVFVSFSWDRSTFLGGTISLTASNTGPFSATFLLRQSNLLTVTIINEVTLGCGSSNGAAVISIPAGALNFIDVAPDPTHSIYQLLVKSNNAATAVAVTGVIMTLVQV